MAEHGTRQCYADGCRRPECKAAQAAYRREYKARKAGAPLDAPKPGRKPRSATVSAIRPMSTQVGGDALNRPGHAAGDAERAVLEELESLTLADSRKSAAQAALAMARILDNPVALPQQPAAAAKLTSIMDDLRKGSGRSKGRLFGLQQMTKAAGA